jgi:hypothetical protein
VNSLREKLEQEDFDRLTASKFVKKPTAILNKPDVPQGATSADHCPQENTAKGNPANATNIVEQTIALKKRRWKGDPVLRNLHQPTAARAEDEERAEHDEASVAKSKTNSRKKRLC